MIEIRLYRLFLLATLVIGINASFKRVCYFSNWSQYRQPPARFAPSDIDANLCTHIVYAFASMEGNKLKTLEENDVQLYRGVNALKRKNTNLKTLLGVGGWNFGTQKMTAMLATDHSRREFAKTSVDFLRKYDFDGIDLDFEYPGSRGSPAEDKQRYARLIQEMRQAFEEDAYLTGKPRLLLTAAVAAGKGNIDRGYDAKVLARSLDFINVMTYDLHGPWDKKVGHNSPMYAPKTASESERQLTVEWAANYWVSLGVPRRMLVIGLPTYGRCFTLQNPSLNKMGDPITGPGKQGKFTRESGFLAYYEICDMKKQGASVVDLWDNEQQVPYLHQGDQWVGYDNVRSVSQKVRWVREKGFGGWMVWNLDLDDFRGSFCGEGKFPLISAMVRAAKGSGSSQSLPTRPSYNNALENQPYKPQPSYVQPSTEEYKPPKQSSFVPLTNEPYKPPQPKPQPNYNAPKVEQFGTQQQTFTAPKVQKFEVPQQNYNPPAVQQLRQQTFKAPEVQQFMPYQPQKQPNGPPRAQQYESRPQSNTAQAPQQTYTPPKVENYQPPQQTFSAPKVEQFQAPKQTYSASKVERYQPPQQTFNAPKVKSFQPPRQNSNPPKAQNFKPKQQTYTPTEVQQYKPPQRKFKPPTQPEMNPYGSQSMKPYDHALQLSFNSLMTDSFSNQKLEKPNFETQTKSKPKRQNAYNPVNAIAPQSTYQQQNSNDNSNDNNNNFNSNNYNDNINNNNNNNFNAGNRNTNRNSGVAKLPNIIQLLDRQQKSSFDMPNPEPGYKWVILPVYAIHPNAAGNIKSVDDIDAMSLTDLTTDLSYSQRNPPQVYETRSTRGLIAVCTRLGPGIHPHPNEHCFKYLMCDHRNGHEMRCDHGTVYDPNSMVCQWPTLVPSRMHCTH